MSTVQGINGPADSDLFISHVRRDWSEPASDPFAPFCDQDTASLVADRATTLQNLLAGSQSSMSKYDQEIAVKQKEMDGLQTLRAQYERERSFGDPVGVAQQMIETERVMTIARSHRLQQQAQSETIVEAIGAVDIRPHTFKGTTSGTCVACNSSISMFNKGQSCTECKSKVHQKCILKLAPLCGDSRAAASAPSVQPYSQLGGRAAGGATMARSSGGSTRAAAAKTSSTSISVGAPAAMSAAPAAMTAIALYDFDAGDAGELSMREGDVLTVTAPADDSGWLAVSLHGQSGIVPLNYVEIQEAPPPPPPVAVAVKEPALPSRPVVTPVVAPAPAAVPQGPRARALYDYEASVDLELSIREGDIIEILDKNVGEGWWEGAKRRKCGMNGWEEYGKSVFWAGFCWFLVDFGCFWLVFGGFWLCLLDF